MAHSAAALDGVGERVARGEPLTDEDAAAIIGTNDLIAVGVLADNVRRRMHGSRTTFCRVQEIHVDAVPSALPAGATYGELRILGRSVDLESAVSAVKALRALCSSAPLTGFALADLVAMETPGDQGAVFGRLRDAGLDAIAELPIDLLPEPAASVERARNAGLQLLRLTVSSLSPERRVAVVCAARDLQSVVGGFRAFAPLPRTLSVAQPTTGYDDVKQVALARLMVADIPSIQVDWPLYGPKLAQVALTVGADDVDGVAAVDGGVLGTRRSPIEEIRGNIRAAAQEPLERNGLFAASEPV